MADYALVGLLALVAWLYWRAMLLSIGLALLIALVTGALLLGAMRRLADLTGHRTTIPVPTIGEERFYWASLGTGLGVWSLVASLVG